MLAGDHSSVVVMKTNLMLLALKSSDAAMSCESKGQESDLIDKKCLCLPLCQRKLKRMWLW